MSEPTPVTDPSVLAQLETPAAANPQPDVGKPVDDPALLEQLNASPTAPGAGASGTFDMPQDKMPFGDSVAIARADNFEEKELYFQNRYGKGAVTREWGDDGNPTLMVKTKDGKTFRVGDSGFVANIAGNSPTLIGMAGGAAEGAELGSSMGPWGTAAGGAIGAGLGALGGKGAQEIQKTVQGDQHKTPTQVGQAFGGAAKEGVVGEMGGQVAGKMVSKALTFRLPKFITGATDESIDMTRQAQAGGARPPYASMAPDLMKLRRIETLAEKTTGKYAQQDERNMAYVKSQLADKLKASGMTKDHVEAFMKEIDGPEYATSHRGVGEELKESVKAHVEALDASVQRAADIADSHIDSQLANVRQIIDSNKHADLSGHVGAAIESAKRDFDAAASSLYDRALALSGSEQIVPVDAIVTAARKIAQEIKEASPLQIPQIVKKAQEMAGKPLSEEDAILLHEFGVEIPPSGKMSLRGAQRLRTVLREKAGAGDLTHNTTQHDFGDIATAVDNAIQDAAQDPAAKPAINALNKADEFYKRNIGKFKDASLDSLMSRIKSGAPPDPEKLVDILSRPGASSRTGRLRTMVGEGVWKRVQSVHMAKYMKRFTMLGEDGKPAVDGMKMLRDLEDGDGVTSIKTIHGQDSVSDMRELAKLAAARRGKIPLEVLADGTPKEALQMMRSAEKQRDEFMSTNALKILADPKTTGEEAYQWVARPGSASESRLLAAAKLFGANSPQMAGLRQAALEEIARNASIHAINKAGNSAIDAALKEYTPTQIDLLFPEGRVSDLREISKVIQFMFPFKSGTAKDTGVAGFTAGEQLELPLTKRVYQQTVSAITRFIALHPTATRWIVTGRRENEYAWMRNTAAMFKRMAAAGVAEAERPENNQTEQQPPAPPAQPGQPPAVMPGAAPGVLH